MVGGGIAQETATIAFFEDDDSENSIVMEDTTGSSLIPFNIILEESREDTIITNGTILCFWSWWKFKCRH